MPLGISELKTLRTLSKVIIEGENGFLITDLRDLKDLQGKFSIKGLEKVQSPMQAQEANISQKWLNELEVEWCDVFDGSRKETLEKDVLNALKPSNDHLKKLEIVSYGGIEFPRWVGDPSFVLLAHVSIQGCRKCTSLPLLGQLPSLKKLFIRGMDVVKAVGLEFLGTTSLAFPSLETLHFEDMQGWAVWSTNNGGIVNTAFPCLQELWLNNCPNLVEVSLHALPSLRVLKTERCYYGVLTSLARVASSVTKLDICSILGLNDQVWGGIMEYLGAVEKLSMRSCNEIRYLWGSEEKASKVLVNLRKLEVESCENLVSLGEKEDIASRTTITSLRTLRVWHCNSLEHCSCPNSIDSLYIDSCASLTSVSFPTGGGQKLKSLSIRGCAKLLEEELGERGENTRMLINSSMWMLEDLHINNCLNLKSISGLHCFVYLTRLEITECPNIELFPGHVLPNLDALKYLVIVNCPSMDPSFPSGVWPPKMWFLHIGGLKKPISKWGPQNFPTSLTSLYIEGGPSEDLSCFSQLSYLFPSSLKCLGIIEFAKLEFISMGLQHLTSLRHLYIQKCPKMIDLPEMLLPSLLGLLIYESPNLKELCCRRGSYWPLISHIPLMLIDKDLNKLI